MAELDMTIKGLCEALAVIEAKVPKRYWGYSVAAIQDAITILKAQEPVKPHVESNLAGQPMWCCGNCRTTLFFKFPKQTYDEDERNHHRFCHYCGRAVNWND